MTRSKLFATIGLTATMAATAVVPTVANASVQNDKNNARNLAIAGAAVAGYGLLTHNTGATVLGLAGALIGGTQANRDQQVENSWHDRWNQGGYYYNRDNRNFQGNYDRDNQDFHRDYNRDNGQDCR